MSVHVTPQWQDVSGGRSTIALATVDHAPQGIEVRRRIAVGRPADSDPGESFLVRSQAGQVPIGIGKRLWLKSALTQVDVTIYDPQAPTPPPGDSDSSIATTGWVQAEIGAVIGTLEDWGEGVGLGNVTADTAALQAAMAAGASISGRRGVPFYYIGQGAVCAAGARLENIALKAKLGPGGFSSKNQGAPVRYTPAQCLLYWNGVDGGGCHNLEIYGDGGGVYVCLAMALQYGFTTKPFIGTGYLFIHHLPMVTGGLAINGIGAAGYSFDTVRIEDGGVSVPNSYWSPVPAFTQTTALGIDGDTFVNSAKGRFNTLIMKRLLLTGQALLTSGDQSDGLTIQGSSRGNTDNGPIIDFLWAEDVDEPVDCQCRGLHIKEMLAVRHTGGAFKLVHGGNHAYVGHLHTVDGNSPVIVMANSASSAVDTAFNVVESVTGERQGYWYWKQGTVVSATATTLVCPAGTLDYDDQWNNYAISLLSGTGQSRTRITIMDCVAATQTLTVASWPAGTPDNTTKFSITNGREKDVVDFQGNGTLSRVANNFVRINGVENGYDPNGGGGGIDFLAAWHCTDPTKIINNNVEVNRDFGFNSVPCSDQTIGGLYTMGRMYAGPGQRGFGKVFLTAAFSTSAATQVTVPFDTVYRDLYFRNAGPVMASISENGFRLPLPGWWHFDVGMRIGSGGADQMQFTGSIYQGGTQFVYSTQSMNGVGGLNMIFKWSFDIYHPENAFSTNTNLYTFRIQPSAATVTNFSTGSNQYCWMTASN